MSDMAGGLGSRLGRSVVAVERCGRRRDTNRHRRSAENRESSRNAAARGEAGLSIVNRAEGIDEIEGEAGRVAASEAGAERVSIDSSDGMM